MTTNEYLDALDRLGLGHATAATSRALGINVRSSQRHAAGRRVSRTLELLIKMYLAHGLPKHVIDGGTEPKTLRATVRKVPVDKQRRLLVRS